MTSRRKQAKAARSVWLFRVTPCGLGWATWAYTDRVKCRRSIARRIIEARQKRLDRGEIGG